jgi:hypothetical protein
MGCSPALTPCKCYLWGFNGTTVIYDRPILKRGWKTPRKEYLNYSWRTTLNLDKFLPYSYAVKGLIAFGCRGLAVAGWQSELLFIAFLKYSVSHLFLLEDGCYTLLRVDKPWKNYSSFISSTGQRYTSTHHTNISICEIKYVKLLNFRLS